MSKKRVRIRIVNKSDNYLGDAGAYDEVSRYIKDDVGSEDAADVADSFGGDVWLGLGFEPDGDMPSMFETEGELEEQDGRITLRYTAALTGALGTNVEYSFDVNEKNVLTVVKRSLFEEIYFFDGNSKKQIVVYEDDRTKLELSLYTKYIKNQLTFANGGFIEIEYFAEMRGGVVEHCREYILVEIRS